MKFINSFLHIFNICLTVKIPKAKGSCFTTQKL